MTNLPGCLTHKLFNFRLRQVFCLRVRNDGKLLNFRESKAGKKYDQRKRDAGREAQIDAQKKRCQKRDEPYGKVELADLQPRKDSSQTYYCKLSTVTATVEVVAGLKAFVITSLQL